MKRLASTAMLIALIAGPALAETVVATRTIRSNSVLTASDLALSDVAHPDGFQDANELIGLEARVVLYQDRPIRQSDVGPAAVVARNQIVTLIYSVGGLSIATEARALARAGVGDVIRVMNLSSRNTITGVVSPDGSVAASGTLNR